MVVPQVLLVLLSLLTLADSQRCFRSGLCSLGHTKPFIGDVSTSQGLQSAAAARSYKKELILHLTWPNRILDVKLLMGNWAKLCMGHVLLMADNEQTGRVVAQELPEAGCAWDITDLPQEPGIYRGWQIRYRTLARLVRMGYNVFMADSDVVIFDDPYRYWKNPVFSQYTIINQPEVLSDPDGYETIPRNSPSANGGVIYVQNAKPDGVAAWLLAEVTDRFLRWADDGYALLKNKNASINAGRMDQAGLNDALSSVATGSIHALETISSYWPIPQANAIKQAVIDQISPRWHYDSVPIPKFMHHAAGDNVTHMQWLDMRMPHMEGHWPEEYGGRWYPETPTGPASTQFMNLLKSDCGGCPLWPDVTDPSTLAAARAVPRERYLFSPLWLMCSYHVRGARGLWLPDAAGSVAQVIGHGHYMPAALAVHKLVWRQWINEYDWGVAEDHWGTRNVFQANMVETHTDSSPYLEDQPSTPRLLVLGQRMRLHLLGSMGELYTVLKGAMQVAVISNRTLVWPDLPCNLSWVGHRNPAHGVFEAQGDWYPIGPRREGSRCLLVQVVNPACILNRRGMLGREYDHFLERFSVTYDIQPHSGNTAFLPTISELHASLSTEPSPASALVEVAVSDAETHMDSLATAQVVHLAHPVRVKDYDLDGWDCLKDRFADAPAQAARPGRITGGRLTLEGGLAPPPAVPTVRVRTAASMQYAGRPTPHRTGPRAWCKPAETQSLSSN